MTEKEIKVILTKNQYDKIKALFIWDEQISQINRYYVNSDTDSGKKLTIRVREENSRYWLQIKRPKSEENSLHISEEYQKELNSAPELLPSETLTELTGFHIPDSHLIGALSTERAVCRSYPNLEICLDKVFYYDVTEYELELEYTDDFPDEAIKMLSENGISFSERVNGKYYRFLRYAKEHGMV